MVKKDDPCLRYHALINAHFDDNISNEKQIELEAHLFTCNSCKKEYRLGEKLKDLMHNAREMLEPRAKEYCEKLASLFDEEQSIQDIVTNTLKDDSKYIRGIAAELNFQYYGRHQVGKSRMPNLQAMIVKEIEGNILVIEYNIGHNPNTITGISDGPSFWVDKKRVQDAPSSISEQATTLDNELRKYFINPNKH